MDPIFVGRGREAAELAGLRAAAAAGRGAVVLLAGEAGIGKTALLGHAVAEAVRAGVPVLAGRAIADEGVPELWPWRRVLEDAGERGLAGLSPDLLALEHESALDPAPAVRFRAFERTAKALRTAAQPGGLVVALEDLHWSDPTSLQLLRFLCGEVTGSRVLVLGTYRDPDGGAEMPAGLAEITGSAAARVIRLAPLAVDDVAAHLRTVAGTGRIDRSWPARIHKHSGGNPLFVRELARLAAQERLLGEPADEVPMPTGLRHLVAHRLAGLSPGCARLLAAGSIIGEEIDVTLLAAVDTAALNHLSEALAAGVLLEGTDAPRTVRFSHDVVRQVCYETMDRAERVSWHQRAAEAIQAANDAGSKGAGANEARLGELARHRLGCAVDAEGRRAAVAACLRAADAELSRLAFVSAVRWNNAALVLVEDGARRGEILLRLAEAAYRDGQVDQSLASCAEAMTLAEKAGDAAAAAAAALVVRGIGGPEANLAIASLCERALALQGASDSALHARLLAQRSMGLAQAGDLVSASPISRRAAEMARRSGDPSAVIDALHAQQLVLTGPAGSEELLVMGRQLREAAMGAGRPDAELWGHIWRIDGSLELGAVAAADVEIFELAGLADRLGWPLARWHLLRARSSRVLMAGRFQEAEELAEAWRDLGLRTQDTSAHLLFYSFISSLETMLGRTDGYAERIGEIEDRISMPVMLASRAVFHLRIGDAQRAAALYERLQPQLGFMPRNQRWPVTMLHTGESAARLADLDTSAVCYEGLLPYEPYYMNQSAGCLGSVARVLGVLATALGELDAADAHLSRAVAMESRIGALPFVALAQLDHARALALRGAPGDRAQATELAGASLRAARRFGMAPDAHAAAVLVDELSGVRGGVAALTPQERTIAALAAEGRTNREIAGHLVLSERTIETHMRNVLRKTGLANRTQLAAWALRAGLSV